MAAWGRCLTACLISAFGWSAGASGECGTVETEELASYRPLTREDFSGARPREAGRARSGGATAIVIVTAMAVDAVEVAAEPLPNGSWIARPASLCLRAYLMKRESGRRSEAAVGWELRHEQGHFDLTEAHARQLEAELTALRASAAVPDAAKRALRNEIAHAYRAASARLQAEQDRYDRETRHGNHRSAQGRWGAAIAAHLASAAFAAQPKLASNGGAEADRTQP